MLTITSFFSQTQTATEEQLSYNQTVETLIFEVAEQVDFHTRMALGCYPKIPKNLVPIQRKIPYGSYDFKIMFCPAKDRMLFQDVCDGALRALRNQLPSTHHTFDSLPLQVLRAIDRESAIVRVIKMVAYNAMVQHKIIPIGNGKCE
jgi:hypothetical protein